MENLMFESLQQMIEDSYPNLSGVIETMVLESDYDYQAFEAALFNKRMFNALDPTNPEDTDAIIASQSGKFVSLLNQGIEDENFDDSMDEELLEELEMEYEGYPEYELDNEEEEDSTDYSDEPSLEALVFDASQIAMESKLRRYERKQYADRALKIKKSLMICARAIKKNKPERALRTLKVMIQTFEKMVKSASKIKNDSDGIAYLTALRDLRTIARRGKMDRNIFNNVVVTLQKARIIDHRTTDAINNAIEEINARGITESFVDVEDADEFDLALESLLNELSEDYSKFITTESDTEDMNDEDNIEDVTPDAGDEDDLSFQLSSLASVFYDEEEFEDE